MDRLIQPLVSPLVGRLVSPLVLGLGSGDSPPPGYAFVVSNGQQVVFNGQSVIVRVA